MSVLKQGILMSVDSPKSKKLIRYNSELWSTKVIDLRGQGKYNSYKKCIHLARCSQVEADNYSSEKFFIKHSDGFVDDLMAENEPERSDWIKCICEVCGLINPLKKLGAPKKSKAPPPLPPPKPISEEKARHEAQNMYEPIDEDDGNSEYTVLSDQPPEPEGGILRYDYADMDRGIRPASVHLDEYGGSGGSTAGASGGGTFHSNNSGSDDDEYIEATVLTPTMLSQAPIQRNQYMNTLDGKDLSSKLSDMKSATLPYRPSSYKDKSSRGRRPMSPPAGSHSLSSSSNNNELLSALNKRKQKIDGGAVDDEVFVQESHKGTPSMYQNSSGMTFTDKEKKTKKPVIPTPGQHNKSVFNKGGPPAIPQKMNAPAVPQKTNSKAATARPELPIQDPPWWNKDSTKDNNDRLDKAYPLPTTQDPPVQNPPWRKKETANNDSNMLNKPYPLPSARDPPQSTKKTAYVILDEERLNNPYPLPASEGPSWSKRKSSGDLSNDNSRVSKPLPKPPQKGPSVDQDRLNRPCPLPPSESTGHIVDSKMNKPMPSQLPTALQKTSWNKRFTPNDESGPPPPPERGSSRKNLFEEPPQVANKSRQLPGKKLVPPPVKPKSPQPPVFDDDDDDFPTADQYKRSQAFNASVHHAQPPRSYHHNPIDNRPPLPPPKQSTRSRYY